MLQSWRLRRSKCSHHAGAAQTGKPNLWISGLSVPTTPRARAFVSAGLAWAPHGPGLRNLLAGACASGASRAAAEALHCCLNRRTRQLSGPLLQAGAPDGGAFSLPRPPPIAPQRQSMAAAAATEDKLLRALADACDSGNKAEVSRLLSAGALVNGKLPGAVSAVRDEVGVVPTRSDHESGCCEAWNRLGGGREKGQMPRLAE